jgi:hypothetical protein
MNIRLKEELAKKYLDLLSTLRTTTEISTSSHIIKG